MKEQILECHTPLLASAITTPLPAFLFHPKAHFNHFLELVMDLPWVMRLIHTPYSHADYMRQDYPTQPPPESADGHEDIQPRAELQTFPATPA